HRAHPSTPLEDAGRMIALPGGPFTMRIRHERRECGCYPFGASDAAMWGWFYKDVIDHAIDVHVEPFAIREAAVTNAEYLRFVHASSYAPKGSERFLAHLRNADGSLPLALAPELGALPVTFVSLDDARAYAVWHRQRLPTEAEWQWAAEGAGL